MNINLYLPIEVKSRELYSKILLAKFAAESGFNVILGRKSELNNLVLCAPPGIYFGIAAFENICKFYEKLKRKRFIIVVNEEEGLITFNGDMYLDMRISNNTLFYIDKFFTWGTEQQKVLEEGFPNSKDKFLVTGNTRFDLLLPHYKHIYHDEVLNITAHYGKFILICTSFSSVNHFDRDLDFINSLIKNKSLRNQKMVNKFNSYFEVKANTFAVFLEAINSLAEAHPEINIIVRPHPSENNKVYQDCAKSHSNVYVDARFSVHPWIMQAEAVVHHYCSTSIEALASQTPRFALRPYKDVSTETDVPFRCSVECENIETLISAISECLTVGKLDWRKPLFDNDYSKYVSNIERPAAAFVIENLFSLISNIRKIGGFEYLVRTYISSLVYIVFKFIKILLRKNLRNNYIEHKFDYLSLNEVSSILDSFGAKGLKCSYMAGDFIKVHASRSNFL